jgi:hypothetical protein
MPLKLRLSYPARSLPPNAGPLRHQHDKLQKHKPKPKPKLGSTLLSHHKAFGIVETQQNQKHKTKPPQSHTHITTSLTQSITLQNTPHNRMPELQKRRPSSSSQNPQWRKSLHRRTSNLWKPNRTTKLILRSSSSFSHST